MLLWPSRSHTEPAAWGACHLQAQQLMVKTRTSATLQCPKHRLPEAASLCKRSTLKLTPDAKECTTS